MVIAAGQPRVPAITTTQHHTQRKAKPMAQPAQKKLKLSDGEIAEFILKVQGAQVQANQNTFTADDILSISYVMSEFIDAVKKIKECPSQCNVELFKQACTDTALLTSLKDPYVSLALELKKAYDLGNVPWFDRVLRFEERFAFPLADGPTLISFLDVSHGVLPDLPDIEDPELRNALDTNEWPSSLVQLGKARYESMVSELVIMRFAERESVGDILLHLTNFKLASHWGQAYHLVIEGSKLHACDVFYGYVGALALVSIAPRQREAFMTWISILIEPIVLRLEDTSTVSETAKSTLFEELPGVEYRLVHTTNAIVDPRYIVQVWAGNGLVMVGQSSAATLPDAERKAAGVALYKRSNIDRTRRILAQFEEQAPEIPQQRQQQPLSQAPLDPFDQPNPTAPPGQPQQMAPQTAATDAAFIAQPMALATQPPEMLSNSNYQRGLGDLERIPRAPELSDENIGSHSKQKLNNVLSDKRFHPAEYTIAKATPTNVQVVCCVENVPLVRAISTSKKRAGQMCAQFILSYLDYFLQMLPPR